MQQLSANELKVRGISAIETVLAQQPEAIISVRGKERFVVMDIAHYHHLRECELEAALLQSRADVRAGHAVQESAAEHMVRLDHLLQATASSTVKAAKARSPSTRTPSRRAAR